MWLKRLKSSIVATSLLVGLLVGVPMLATAPVYAQTSKDNACAGLKELDGTQKCNAAGESAINNLIKNVVNLLSIIVGVASVIAIIISGLKFITAGGESSAVASAKSTLIYALIGLMVAVLAQFMVHFVIDKLTTSPPPAQATISTAK